MKMAVIEPAAKISKNVSNIKSGLQSTHDSSPILLEVTPDGYMIPPFVLLGKWLTGGGWGMGAVNGVPSGREKVNIGWQGCEKSNTSNASNF
jgi:hypothetical protein